VTEAARTAREKANAGGVVEAVRPGSVAERLGLRAGDRVVAVDGRAVRDAVDVRFATAEERVALEVVRDGAATVLAVEKDPDEDLGVEFREATFDGIRICNNSCFFCFLKGNPKGMRKTLYVKDDDYRLSFVHGNFVTLTNLDEDDWARLAEQRLSPINVSVHATDVELRRYLLGNREAPDIVAQLRRLGSLGIRANTQVVLCPGVNDGAALDRTIADLRALWPTVETVSVVPVGATMTAEERIARGAHAPEVDACTPEYARSVIAQVRPHQRRFRREIGRTFVYLADEYYLAAGVEVPGAAQYDGFAQYENGIGMVRWLLEDWRRARRGLGGRLMGTQGLARVGMGEHRLVRGDGASTVRQVTFVCGTLVAPVLERLAGEFRDVTGVAVDVVAGENSFFGPRVNVSGLLVSGDIEAALVGRELGDLVVLPRYALDYSGTRFLDDRTPSELQRALGVPIAFASSLGEVLGLVRGGVDCEVSGAGVGATTNGKSWVEAAP
jgi:putative radical SAM enzyme (TIGR03279 family)